MFDTYYAPEAEVYAIKSMQALALNKNPQPERSAAAAANADNDENGGDQDAMQQATQTTTIGPGLTKKEAEETLEKFVDEGWLVYKRLVSKFSLFQRAENVLVYFIFIFIFFLLFFYW